MKVFLAISACLMIYLSFGVISFLLVAFGTHLSDGTPFKTSLKDLIEPYDEEDNSSLLMFVAWPLMIVYSICLITSALWRKLCKKIIEKL